MKRISENTKITLTLGQIKRLIEESSKFNMTAAIAAVKEKEPFRRRLIENLLNGLFPGIDIDFTDNGGGAIEAEIPQSISIRRLKMAIRRNFAKNGAWILFNRAYHGMASIDFYADGDLVFTVTGPDAEIKDNEEDSYELAAYATIDR